MESKAIKCIDFYNPTFTQFQTRSFIDCVYVRVCVCVYIYLKPPQPSGKIFENGFKYLS